MTNQVNGFTTEQTWNKDYGIQLWCGITAKFSTGKMNLPIKEESNCNNGTWQFLSSFFFIWYVNECKIQTKIKCNCSINIILLKLITCIFYWFFSPLFKHGICALCFQTLYSFNIRSPAINIHKFMANPHYTNSVHATIFCSSFSMLAHLI